MVMWKQTLECKLVQTPMKNSVAICEQILNTLPCDLTVIPAFVQNDNVQVYFGSMF